MKERRRRNTRESEVSGVKKCDIKMQKLWEKILEEIWLKLEMMERTWLKEKMLCQVTGTMKKKQIKF